jgi:protocatechuate 3,4-dioxygenase beta subunit
MERKNFLRNSLGLAGLGALLLDACKKSEISSSVVTTTTDGSCIVSPAETEGPFPYTTDGNTRSEISNPLNRADIRSNSSDGVLQTGLPLSLIITVVNVNNNCALVSGARVDLWHCNRYGYYSGYGNQSGGLNGQANSYLGENWLRGYQLTDSNGEAKFTTIYPGWYQGRATHIHFEVYLDSVMKKTTQLTFPETISDAVHVTSLYAAHGINTTRNANDNVFGDSATDLANEIFTMTGDATNGYTGTHTIGLALLK